MTRKQYFQHGAPSKYDNPVLNLTKPKYFGYGWRKFRPNKSKPK